MRYIEYNLPFQEISHYSAIEKYIRHGHPSTLHIWWARRPLAASRATILASLIDLPEDDERKKEFEELLLEILPWDKVKKGNSKSILKARETILKQWGRPPKILDPFSGGGTIPFEALRLGCHSFSSDLNPVSVIIQKGTLEWPQKFGVLSINKNLGQATLSGSIKQNILSYLVDYWAKEVLSQVKKEISHFYPNDPDGNIPVGYLWARTIECQNPNCHVEIPLIKQFWLSPRKKIYYKPLIDEKSKKINYTIKSGEISNFDPSQGTVSRGNAKCLICGQITNRKTIRKMSIEGKLDEKLIIIILHKKSVPGKTFRLATKNDVNIYNEAIIQLKNKLNNWEWMDSPLPEENIIPNPRYMTPYYYGLQKWKDLFNYRQQLSIITFIDKIKLNYEKIKKHINDIILDEDIDKTELVKAVMSYLSINVSRLADKNSNLVMWDCYNDKISHVFTRSALSMIWDYVELNVFSGVNGDWLSQLEWIIRFIEANSWETPGKSYVNKSSATSLSYDSETFDAVFTDPPYYDNIPYADLSDFFYVWHKKILGDIYPELFQSYLTNKEEEIVANPIRQKNPNIFFQEQLSDSFKEIYRVLKQKGLATIVYAYKTTTGWESMLNSLVNSGLIITASWPIHTEMKSRLRSMSSAALASSIYMVCRKIKQQEIGFWNDLKAQIKEKIENKLHQFWNEGIVGGDFFISAIGPGMEIFSKYKIVENYSGEKVSTYDLLIFIRSIVTEFIINELLKNGSPTRIDKESQFYLAYRWTYQKKRVLFDDARKLASAMGVDLENLWIQGFVKKTTKYIQVLGPKERGKPDRIDNMVDVMHHSVLLWEIGKDDELKNFLFDTGYNNSEAFWQFCQAVAESLLPGDKEKQLLEGLLIGRDRYTDFKLKDSKQKRLGDFVEE